MENNNCQCWFVSAAKGIIKVGGVWRRGDSKYLIELKTQFVTDVLSNAIICL
jgi:hypothetical protein